MGSEVSPTILRCGYIFRQVFHKDGTVDVESCVYDAVGAARNGAFYCQEHLAAFSRWMGGDVSALPPVEEVWR